MSQPTRLVLTIVTIVIAAVIVLALLGSAGMMGGPYGPGMMGGWGYRAGGWSGLPVVFTVLVVAGLGLVAVWAVQESRHTTQQADGRRPLDILKERYARGDLTREQYEQMRRDLE